MAHWLLKTEPGDYSWDDLVAAGRATWDGITNPLALIHLRSTAAGDQALIYHTGKERRAVGIAKIVKGPHPDPRSKDPKRPVIQIAPVRPLATPVTLDQIKKDPAFAQWDLLRNTRLSFVPVPDPIWRRLLALSEAS
ncbi:MAG TPA: EVE domain-containing protein [Candidatus Polarisedimenticolia bacterium]|nr:EVE domain-containing protein [Candidatus Polarisedimenticolia bacterium]